MLRYLLCRCARIGSSINQITVSISGCLEKQRRTDWPIDAADALHIHSHRIYWPWMSLEFGCFVWGRSGVACAPISELISRHRSYPGPSIMFARSDETETGNLAALPVKPIEGSETLRGWARQSGSRSESEDGRAATQNEIWHPPTSRKQPMQREPVSVSDAAAL
ncbi:hypothetical protein F5882DRAFT_41401 [Hyaloscypha sp. PMI_1271]|nr:hypothetical protein F5882DRAFT_41401 [Hyaloscypha sp. PMI_1271]